MTCNPITPCPELLRLILHAIIHIVRISHPRMIPLLMPHPINIHPIMPYSITPYPIISQPTMSLSIPFHTIKPIFHCDTKYLALGGGVGQFPLTPELFCWRYQHVGIFEPTQNVKFASAPTQNPNASQWNIGCIGCPTQNFHVGHVHFMLLCQFDRAPDANPFFSGIWA